MVLEPRNVSIKDPARSGQIGVGGSLDGKGDDGRCTLMARQRSNEELKEEEEEKKKKEEKKRDVMKVKKPCIRIHFSHDPKVLPLCDQYQKKVGTEI